MRIGERVRIARQSLEWTQTDLHEASGVPQSTIAEIETGKTQDPGASVLVRLARALMRPVAWFTAKDPNALRFAYETRFLEIVENLPAPQLEAWLIVGEGMFQNLTAANARLKSADHIKPTPEPLQPRKRVRRRKPPKTQSLPESGKE
jgi:transcriptional regulator with XRE-family HTH domain